MKIVVVQLLDGPCVRTRKTISSLLRAGHHVTYLGVPRGGERIEDQKFSTVLQGRPIPRGSWRKLYLQFYFFYKARAYLNSSCFDIAYAVDLDGAMPVVLSRFRRKYLYEVLDTYADRYRIPGIFSRLLRRLESNIASRSIRCIHVDSMRVSTLNSSGKNVVVVENVPRLDDLPCFAKVCEGRDYFLISGGVFRHRGLEQILMAHQIFCEKYGDVKLLIVGRVGGAERSIIEVYKNVEVVGEVSSSEALAYTTRAYAVFALYEPSSNINLNACPNKIYDCLLNGTPIIINSELKIKSRYVDSILVLDAPYYNIDALVSSMSRAVYITHDKESLRSAAADNRARLNWDGQFKEVLEVIDNVS